MPGLFKDTFLDLIFHIYTHPDETESYQIPAQWQAGYKGKHGMTEEPPQEESDCYVVDWDSPDDYANPQNWSRARKISTLLLICLLTTSVYMGSSIITPALTLIAPDLSVGLVVASLGVTLFVWGYGLGPMLGLTAISEVPIVGRTIPYIITLACFVILQIPTALVTNIAGFAILRFLSGFFGSPPLATGGASIGDMYMPLWQPVAMGAWGLSAAAGPVLGPLIGSFASQALGWRWSIWPLLMLSGATLIVLIVLLPETSSANILTRKAARLRKRTGNPHLRSPAEVAGSKTPPSELLRMVFLRPYTLMVTEPIILAIDVHIGLVYGILYLWFEAFPIVFTETYGFNAGEQSLTFLAIFIASFATYGVFVLWVIKDFQAAYRKLDGRVPPEKWWFMGMFGGVALPVCMFSFGWTSNGSIHWIAPTLCTMFFGIAVFTLFQSGLTYLTQIYPAHIASVLSGNDFARAALGGAMPLVGRAMFTNLQKGGPTAFPVAWGCTLMGCIALLMMPIPFLLYFKGSTLRRMSKRALQPDAGEEDAEKTNTPRDEDRSDARAGGETPGFQTPPTEPSRRLSASSASDVSSSHRL